VVNPLQRFNPRPLVSGRSMDAVSFFDW